ncbi:MAG: chromosomal replication initiator protein DnaA [Acidimicrobiales bacterium]
MTGVEELWTICSSALRAQVTEATWRTWFEGVRPLALVGDNLSLAVPSNLVKERLEGRYRGILSDVISNTTAQDLLISFEVQTDDPIPDDEATMTGLLTGGRWDAAEPPTPSMSNPPPPPKGQAGRQESLLNDEFTFEAFIIGSSNRFAHAAALSVAETPAKSYNPLFIYGGAGLGKTHLLHAIGNYVRENFPARHVRYVTTETFLNEFVDAIRTNTPMAFKRRYRECDVLLVDDIQFMENKEGLQEEFFHTFNSLHGASKQIVITSDRPPKSIATLEERLRSRFLSGLMTDVKPPELETRLAIMRKKSEGERIQVPDDVLEFIATHIKDNIRELEGALTRVCAFANLNHEILDVGLAEKVLSDIVSGSQPHPITPRIILEATSQTFGFTIDELCGTSRRRPLVTARQVSMYVFRDLTDFSYPAIAKEFGGRDHSTVIHAVDKISKLMKENRQIYDQVTDLILLIKNRE